MVQLLFRFRVQSLSVGKYYTNNYRNDCELSRSDYSPITALKDRLVFKILTDNVILIEFIGVSRGYTDYHQGRAIHMADSHIH